MTLAQLSLDCRFSSENKKTADGGKSNILLSNNQTFYNSFQNEYCDDTSSPDRSFEVIKMFALWFISDLTRNVCSGVVIAYLTS